MGYGATCICYNNYQEKGEISANELIDSILLFRNRSHHYSHPNTYNYNEQNENIYIYSPQSSSYHNLSYIINNDDISFQLDSRILENTDGLCPEKKKCTICLDNFENKDRIINLSCLHMFHSACIRKWLKKNNTCPICKNQVEMML